MPNVPVLIDDPDNTSQIHGSDVSAADVVLYGLNIIVPLMTAELLKVIVYICFISCLMMMFLTLSPLILLRLYTLPYWSNPPFLIFDIRVLWRSEHPNVKN